MATSQPACQGCCLNWPYFNYHPALYCDPIYFGPPSLPEDTKAGLLPDEIEILRKTADAWELFSKLDKKSLADNAEFLDSIHRLQQIIALRVARRANPEVWAQPE